MVTADTIEAGCVGAVEVEGVNGSSSLLHSDKWPIDISRGFLGAKLLSTEALIDAIGATFVYCSLSLLSPEGTNLPEPMPLRSLGLVMVQVSEKPTASWVPSLRSVGTEKVDLVNSLF